MRFVSTKRRRRDQWKPCLKGPVFYSSRTSQDKTSNAESFDSESVTSCRISGCLSDVAKEITDSPLVQSKIFQAVVFIPKRSRLRPGSNVELSNDVPNLIPI